MKCYCCLWIIRDKSVDVSQAFNPAFFHATLLHFSSDGGISLFKMRYSIDYISHNTDKLYHFESKKRRRGITRQMYRIVL